MITIGRLLLTNCCEKVEKTETRIAVMRNVNFNGTMKEFSDLYKYKKQIMCHKFMIGIVMKLP
jgi:hypothetical protein